MPRDLLRRYPLFRLLTPHQLDVLVSAGQQSTFRAGETIFQEGSAGAWAYLVLAGRVRPLRVVEGREISLGTFGQGEVFGEYALLAPHRNTCTCRAADRTRLLRFSLLPLRHLFATTPGVGPNLKNWLRLHGLLGYLRGQSFLGFMLATSALTFLDHLQPAAFPARHTIQAEDLAGDRWYFIDSGRVCLQPDGEAGQPCELEAGDCFGEQALQGHGGLPLAVALTDTRCQALSREAFTSRSGSGQPASLQSLIPQLTTLRKKYTWVGQREEADCGVAALALVARCHGLTIDLDRLRGLVPVGEQGTTLLGLSQAGSALGLRCQAVRVELERLAQVSLPAIAHLRSGHYVVLYELEPTGVVIGDPATGIGRVSLGAFRADCSGSLLLLQP